MSLEPGVLDANVLIYALASEAPKHVASRALLNAIRDDPGLPFYVASQTLCEF
jgi:predicted nucleic acid-binding protein